MQISSFALASAALLGGHQAPRPTTEIAASPATSITSLERTAQLADLAELATELPKRHVAPYHRTSRRAFDQAVTKLRRRIQLGIDNDQAFVGMGRLVSLMGDGHSLLAYPVTAPLFGLRFTKISGHYRLTAVAASSASVPALGGRLIAVDGIPIDAVERRLMDLTPADETPALREARLAALLDRGMVLHGARISKKRGAAHFTFTMDDGRRIIVAPTASDERSAAWLTAAQREPNPAETTDQSFACRLADPSTIYCDFRSYQSLDTTSAAMFAKVAKTGARRLVIDLRKNNGGDFCAGLGYLIKPIEANVDLNRPGHLYVLIGPETFSAAMSNAVHFRQLTQAVLVGQPIGEIPNSYQENKEFTLPSSGWVVHYSTKSTASPPSAQMS